MDKKIKPLNSRGFISVKNPVSKFSKIRVLFSKNRHHDVAWFLDREQTSINFRTNSSINFFLIIHIND